MRRVSLSVVALLLSVANTAPAGALPVRGADARASVRQDPPCDPASSPGDSDCDGVPDSEDKCPSQYGTGRGPASGCPDADGDGLPDAADKCPTVSGGGVDGCPAFHVFFNAYLGEAWFYADCTWRDAGAERADCSKVTGSAVVTINRAAARRLKLPTRIGSFSFDHPCGAGIICARTIVSAALKRKLKHASRDPNGNPVYVAGAITFEMTSPRVETITRSVHWGVGTNGGQYRICGSGWPPANYSSPSCGGKSSGGEEG